MLTRGFFGALSGLIVVLSVVGPGLGRENLSGRELLKKGIAAVLVALGVTLVTH